MRRQAIVENNAGLFSIGPLWTNFSEILIKIQDFSFMKMHINILSAKQQPFCPGGDEFKGAVSYRFSQGLLTLMCNNSELEADINFFFFLLRRQTS